MKSLKQALVGGIAGLALALPAGAAAAPSVPDVRERVQAAKASLDYATWAAEMGNAQHARAAYRKFARITKRADRITRRVRGAKPKARAMRLVGNVTDLSFDRFADLLDEVPAHVQGVVASIIGQSAEARERVLNVLTRLAERLPEPARSAVLDAIARYTTDGDVEALVAALTSDAVLDSVKTIVTGHLESVTGHLSGVLDRLGELGAVLPPRAQQAVSQAVALIQAQLESISGLIGGILDGLPIGGGGGGLPGGVTGGLCDLLGGLPIPIPLVCD